LTAYSAFARPLFRPGFLGDKWPAVDFYVELNGIRGKRPYFLVQCKSTSANLAPQANTLAISSTRNERDNADTISARAYRRKPSEIVRGSSRLLAIDWTQTLNFGVRMSSKPSRSQFIARRGELMAELYLEELGPQFVSRPAQDVGYDLLVGFLNDKGGINTFAVKVESTELPPGARFHLLRRTFDRFAHSNIPGLLLVADVKQNRLYYAWLTPKKSTGSSRISIPLIELNDENKNELQEQFVAAEGGVVVAG
jgi:hypothetical protein